MRIAHICASCGIDLTGVSAPIDAVLRLPIVVCPGCKAAVVRRKHPTLTWTRRAVGVVHAIIAGAFRGAGSLAFCGAVYASADLVWSEGLRFMAFDAQQIEAAGVAMIIWLSVALAAGFWFGFIFPNRRFWQNALLWAAVIGGALGVVGAADQLDAFMSFAVDNRSFRPPLDVLRSTIPTSMSLVALAWAFSLITIPLGRLAGRWFERSIRRRLWRRACDRRITVWTAASTRR